ncbi:hypothetical protein [Paenibacillus sp. NPDC058071]|uniref:hypothetical protein n=1 Tax=Paenibacillus sp. NPDC058071 TaxID=3346326 RepID=UPI0036DBC746
MEDAKRTILFMNTIGVLLDLVFAQQIEDSVEDLEHALYALGLDGRKLLNDQPLIQTLHEVCSAFGASPMNAAILDDINDINAVHFGALDDFIFH